MHDLLLQDRMFMINIRVSKRTSLSLSLSLSLSYVLQHQRTDAFITNSSRYYELETLILKRCPKITDKTFDVLEPGCDVVPLLYDNKSVAAIPSEIKLAHLDVAQCRNITDLSLKRLSRCKRLDTLKLESLDRITDDGVLLVASSCSRLRVMDMMSVHNVTSKSISSLVHSCSGLTDLNLVRCLL